MSAHDIVFIGSSPVGLKQLHENKMFKVLDVLCLEDRVTGPLKDTAAELGFTLKEFRWIKDFKKLILSYPEDTPFFIYQLDMLVPGSLTKAYRFFNLHRGNLQTNRGPNPDIWPLLNGDSTTALSLHQINEKIDAGVLIYEYLVPITDVDDTSSLRAKLERGIPLTIDALDRHFNGKLPGKKVKNGKYYPWVTEEDFTIDLERDSLATISQKIRSQTVYNGAILHLTGSKHYIKALNIGDQIDQNLTNCITITIENQPVQLVTNPAPKYPPPATHPPAKRI